MKPTWREWSALERKRTDRPRVAPVYFFNLKNVESENLTGLSQDGAGLFYFNLRAFSVCSVCPKKKVFKRKAQIDGESPKTERCVPKTLCGMLFLFSKNIYIIFGDRYIYIYPKKKKAHQVGTRYLHQRTGIQWNSTGLFKMLHIHPYLLPKTSKKNH